MHLSAGQPPEQERIDCAERQPACFGRRPRAINMIQQPRDLGAGKVRIKQQTGLLRHARLMTRGLQLGAVVRGPAILPDNGIMDGTAGFAIPENRRLALVGDADGGNIGRPGIDHSHRGTDTSPPSSSRCLRDHAQPNPIADNAEGILPAPWPRPPGPGRTGSRGSTSCLGLSPERILP